jgi:cobalt-zinc-cadmium efflux system protein
MRRGEIWLAVRDPGEGAEPNAGRPVALVSNDTGASLTRGMVTVVPITTTVGHIYPFQVLLPAEQTGLENDSKAQAEQVHSVDVARLTNRVGVLPGSLLREVDSALRLWQLALALGLSFIVLIAEVAGGLLLGSLALLADAGHVLTDVAGLGLALGAIRYARRPPTARRTWGSMRVEILAAAINACVLSVVGALVLIEAFRRWEHPPQVTGLPLLAVASLGLVTNAIALSVLRTGAAQSLNVRGAYLEVLGDLLGSGAVVVAAIVITTTGWARADVVAAALVGLIVLPRAFFLLRETIDVLMLATPRDVELDDVRRHMIDIAGVIDVHDLHAWTITSGMRVLSAHVVVEPAVICANGLGILLDELGGCLAEHFDVEHSTFQIEPPEHAGHEEGVHP